MRTSSSAISARLALAEIGASSVVERVTERIRDGQRIRVHGSDGYVEIIETDEPAETVEA